MIACRLVVRGRVQGVCFRDWTVAAACEAGIAGWVRNRADGTVEIVAEGSPDAVAAFVRACHEGPPAAHVDAVDVAEAAPLALKGFARRPTA